MPPIIVRDRVRAVSAASAINPSWEVARNLDGDVIGGLQVSRCDCRLTARRRRGESSGAFVRYRPRAILGLGQAGGRPAISMERIAINLADERGALARHGDPGITAVVRGGPDAYFSRLPMSRIIRELDRKDIPASVSLTAGAYACNARCMRRCIICGASRGSRWASSICRTRRGRRDGIGARQACR